MAETTYVWTGPNDTGLPYPTGGSPPDGAKQIKKLAESIAIYGTGRPDLENIQAETGTRYICTDPGKPLRYSQTPQNNTWSNGNYGAVEWVFDGEFWRVTVGDSGWLQAYYDGPVDPFTSSTSTVSDLDISFRRLPGLAAVGIWNSGTAAISPQPGRLINNLRPLGFATSNSYNANGVLALTGSVTSTGGWAINAGNLYIHKPDTGPATSSGTYLPARAVNSGVPTDANILTWPTSGKPSFTVTDQLRQKLESLRSEDA